MEKRKNYFIDKKFQTNFILKFCFLVVVTSAFILIVLYVFSGKAATVSFVNSRVVVQTTADFIFPLLIQTLMIAVVVVGFMTVVGAVFISHRIAGPAYRFKKVLSSLAEGDFTLKCTVRSKDSLRDVGAALDGMIVNVRKGLNLVDRDLNDLKAKLDAGNSKEIKETVSELDKNLHNFKF